MKKITRALCLVLISAGIFAIWLTPQPAGAEVRLFVDKHTVRVNDPGLGQPSILNDFNPSGYRTHNYLALVWNSHSVWVYDIRTHQWMSTEGFAPMSGLLSDELALVWERGRVAVYSAPDHSWVVSAELPSPITGQLISRGMAAVTCEDAFVVYDPVLKTWQTAGDFMVGDAELGDNLAVAWDENDALIYDLTLHQWVMKEGIAPQACIVEPFKVSIYSSDRIYIYDAMSHRWQDMPR
ncbi:MAG: hypothetical protein Q7I97_03755 [Thermovirgaceae bacterium]|nr:hypothetical protein [Thermovirgaceae bacterium]